MGHGWELLNAYFPARFKRAVAESLGILPLCPACGWASEVTDSWEAKSTGHILWLFQNLAAREFELDPEGQEYFP